MKIQINTKKKKFWSAGPPTSFRLFCKSQKCALPVIKKEKRNINLIFKLGNPQIPRKPTNTAPYGEGSDWIYEVISGTGGNSGNIQFATYSLAGSIQEPKNKSGP